MTVPYDPKQPNNSWWFYIYGTNKKVVMTRCTNGHIGSLADHTIAPDGTVSPSVVCQVDGCDFHAFIKLEGYDSQRLG